jgi:hypothetical protein
VRQPSGRLLDRCPFEACAAGECADLAAEENLHGRVIADSVAEVTRHRHECRLTNEQEDAMALLCERQRRLPRGIGAAYVTCLTKNGLARITNRTRDVPCAGALGNELA